MEQQVPASNNDATINEAKLEQQVAECYEWFSTLGLDVVKEDFEMPLDDGSPEDIKLPTAREMENILTEEEVKEQFRKRRQYDFVLPEMQKWISN